MLDWLTPAERRGAAVLAILLLVGAAHDAWRAHRMRATTPTTAAAAPQNGTLPRATAVDSAVGRTTPSATPARGARLDLNRADAAALESLPGIGPVLARRIVEHRATHGRFVRVEDLLAVRGIGPRLFVRIAPTLRTAPDPDPVAPWNLVQTANPRSSGRADSSSVERIPSR